jgi:predicted transposase YdaD
MRRDSIFYRLFTEAPNAARKLIQRIETEQTPADKRAIIELVKTIIVYKFTNLRREEIEAMLDITLQETRVYQDAKQEEAVTLILRQLRRRLRQEVAEPVRLKIVALPLEQLEQLGEDLLDFGQPEDLLQWLQVHQPQA